MTAAGVSILALAMLLLGGCGGEQPGAAQIVEPVERSADVDLPRSVTYGDWKWTVENATVADGQVTLDITVENYLDEHFSGEVTLDDVSLLDGSGVATVPADSSGASQLDLDVPPGGRAQGTLAFEVADGFSLDTASFQIAQADAEPAVLPFNGEQPDHYPIDVDLTGTTKKGSASPSRTMFTFEPLAATAHLDASGVRVAEDSRWLTVTLRVTSEDRNGADGRIGAHTVRLVADGDAIDARLSPNVTVRPGESVELDYLFELPLDAAKVKLRVGEASDGSKQHTIPLDLPDLP